MYKRQALGRTVRVINPNDNLDDYLHLREVEVYSGGVNVALAGTASQSTLLSGYPASNVIDANYATFNHTLNSTSPGEYWQVDLGSDMAIDQIILYNRADCAPTCPNRLDNYTIEIINSAGETVWMSGPNPTPAGDVDTFDTDAINTLTAEAINLENNGTLRVDFGDVDGTAGAGWDPCRSPRRCPRCRRYRHRRPTRKLRCRKHHRCSAVPGRCRTLRR